MTTGIISDLYSLGIESMSLINESDMTINFCDAAKVIIIESYPRNMTIIFGDADKFPCGGNFLINSEI